MKTSKASGFFDRKIKPENKLFIENSLDIAVEVNSILDEYGWTQKDLAEKLGKSESEISKWLSGFHNLTLKSISKIEAVLERKVIEVPSKGLFYSYNLERKGVKFSSLEFVNSFNMERKVTKVLSKVFFNSQNIVQEKLLEENNEEINCPIISFDDIKYMGSNKRKVAS